MKQKIEQLLIIFVPLFLILALFLPGCSTNPQKPTTIPAPKLVPLPVQTEPTPKTETGIGILPSPQIRIPVGGKGTIDKTAYLTGENVKIQFSLGNSGSEPIILGLSQPEIIIRKSGLSENNNFARSFANMRETEIQPGTQYIYEVVWDQKYDNGKQAEPGWHTIVYKYSYRNASSTEGYASREGGVGRFVIMYPIGKELEKVINVNQSQTISGLPLRLNEKKLTTATMTLERVEFSAEGTDVVVFVTSPDYYFPTRGSFGVSPEWHRVAVAQYRSDNIPKQAGDVAYEFLEGGIRLNWGRNTENPLDPISKNTQVLTFTITSYGNWQGPWEFQIPMN